jgi:hypothetical protein
MQARIIRCCGLYLCNDASLMKPDAARYTAKHLGKRNEEPCLLSMARTLSAGRFIRKARCRVAVPVDFDSCVVVGCFAPR